MQNNTTQTLDKNGYAAFDAVTLRNLIIEKLNAEGTFTDQNYIGSNLASIIDIISYAYNTLIFYLNKTGSESSFTEAQLLENINRIVKLVGYSPTGYQTSALTVGCSAVATEPGLYTLQRYSYVTAQSVSYSVPTDVTFFVGANAGVYAIDDAFDETMLFQGLFQEYPLLTAQGKPSETFALVFPSQTNIDHTNMDVYVLETEQDKWFQYTETQSILDNVGTDRVFERRLNENGNYEIKFGDNVYGKQLTANDAVAVFYLASNRTAGVVGPGAFNQAVVRRMVSPRLQAILADIAPDEAYLDQNSTGKLRFSNTVGSTEPTTGESVAQIKERAPKAFLAQNRLVTATDYEQFVKRFFGHFVADIKVMNNWDYMSTYFKYFHDIGIADPGFANLGLLNQVRYADACNFNNVYLCLLPQPGQQATRKFLTQGQKNLILADTAPHKMLTTEVVFADPIYKAITFGVSSTQTFDLANVSQNSFLSIKRHERSKRNPNAIAKDVAAAIRNYFRYPNNTLGKTLELTELTQSILAVDGVGSFSVKNSADGSSFQGLSLVVWNPDYADEDKQIAYANVQASPCEYFYLSLSSAQLVNKIIVEADTFNSAEY